MKKRVILISVTNKLLFQEEKGRETESTRKMETEKQTGKGEEDALPSLTKIYSCGSLQRIFSGPRDLKNEVESRERKTRGNRRKGDKV